MREAVIHRILNKKLIAIVRGIRNREQCLALAGAILDGGIDLLEITFDQSAPENFSDTLNAITAVNQHFEGRICVGAGTVMTPEQVKLAADAGAKYMISPNVNADVIEATRSMGLVSMPGAMSPSEIAAAHGAGADFVKLFPAGVLGCDYVRAVRAPLSQIRILAVGGVNPGNIPDFLAAGCLGFGIGGNLVNKQWVEAGEFDKITEVAKQFCSAVGR